MGGIVRIALGAVAVLWPGAVAIAMAMAFGAFAVASGLTALAAARYLPSQFERRSVLRRFGVIGVVLGVLTLARPGLTLYAAMAVVGVAAVVHGLRRARTMSGLASVLVGAVVLVRPAVGITALGLIVGTATIASGVLHVLEARPRMRLSGLGLVAAS